MSDFETVDTEMKTYRYTEDDTFVPGQATIQAKQQFSDEHGIPFDEVIGKKVRDGEYEYLGRDEFEMHEGPVIVCLHDPRA